MGESEHMVSGKLICDSYRHILTDCGAAETAQSEALKVAKGLHRFLNDGRDASGEAVQHYMTVIREAMDNGHKEG